MIHINVKRNNGFAWYIVGNIYAKGYIYTEDNKLYREELLCHYFENITNIHDLIEKVTCANGLFSVIIRVDQIVLAAVDRFRTFPLFYHLHNENQMISDDPESVIQSAYLDKIDRLHEQEFLSTGFVTGKYTLISELYQVQTGAVLKLSNQGDKQIFYHSYVTDQVHQKSYAELCQDFIKVLESSFERFIHSLSGRTVLLSLSGGYDSRLIAAILKMMKYEKVICYSYGKKDNNEARISKMAAKKLGYDWIFINYKNILNENYPDDSVFLDYYPYAANFTSMFFLEQYFAVKYLREAHSIPKDSVFCAGHSGDFLAGSQLVKNGHIKEQASIDKIVKSILKIKYSYQNLNKDNRSIFSNNIRKFLKDNMIGSNSLAYSMFENWDLKEKLAKFIFNSAIVYNYFGYEHRLPLMDNELIDFFRKVPYKYKIHKRLYDDIAKNYYFTPYDLNFDFEIQPTKVQIFLQEFKNKLYPFLPSPLMSKIRIKNDIHYQAQLTDTLIKNAESDSSHIETSGKNFNPVIIKWYLFRLSKTFS